MFKKRSIFSVQPHVEFASPIISSVPFVFFALVSAGWDSSCPAVPGANFPWMSPTTYGTQGSCPKMEPVPTIDLRNH